MSWLDVIRDAATEAAGRVQARQQGLKIPQRSTPQPRQPRPVRPVQRPEPSSRGVGAGPVPLRAGGGTPPRQQATAAFRGSGGTFAQPAQRPDPIAEYQARARASHPLYRPPNAVPERTMADIRRDAAMRNSRVQQAWRVHGAERDAGNNAVDLQRMRATQEAWGGRRSDLDHQIEAAEERQPRLDERLSLARAGGDPNRSSGEEETEDAGYTTRRMTPSEYRKLTPRQQAAVQFNTGLIEASEQGDREVKRYLTDLGVQTTSEEDMDAFLRLDRLIDESILEKLESTQAVQQSAWAQRAARGAGGTEQSEQLSRARSVASLAAELMQNQQLAAGSHTQGLRGEPVTARPGWGSSPRDRVIQNAWATMVDSRWDLRWEDVVRGVDEANEIDGTDVDPEEVWQFGKTWLDAMEAGESGNLAGQRGVLAQAEGIDISRMTLPDVHPATGEQITPLDVAEIRERYGL